MWQTECDVRSQRSLVQRADHCIAHRADQNLLETYWTAAELIVAVQAKAKP